jgi:anti-sigma regulatory factor (Ser/Thr protein kinase)
VPLSADVASRVELLVSELATNAVVHARTAYVVHVARSEHTVRVTVSDHSPDPPVVRQPSPDEPCGRGLLIVAAMSAAWGVTETTSGKDVWFEVDDEAAPTR